MTRSLLLTTSFPPTVGGLETLLYQTSRRLAEPPLVLAPPPASASDLYVRQVLTGPLGRLAYRAVWPIHPSLHYLGTFWQAAAQAMGTWRPEVVQVGHIALAPLAWLLARRGARPFVIYAHGQELLRSAGRPTRPPSSEKTNPRRPDHRLETGNPRTVHQWLDSRLRGGALGAAGAVLTQGRFTSGLLAAWDVPPERIVQVPFGAEPRPPVAPPLGTSLLSVGRLVPRKGIDTVLRALASLPDSVTYRVVGSGPDVPRLRGLARALGVAERVHFLGRLSDAELAEEYQRCALFVLPTRRTTHGEHQLEGFGLVFFEAAAWGRPVLAGRSGGEIDAVIDGETGQLVDGQSVEQVASAIRELLADPKRLHRLGEQGRWRVETSHNWDRAAAAVDDVLRRLA